MEEVFTTYAMVYSGAEVAGDGDQVTFKHRRDFAILSLGCPDDDIWELSMATSTKTEEASSLTFDIVDHVLKKRKSYLCHLLRLDPELGVRRYFLELNPDTAPFAPDSLLSETSFGTVEEIIEVAQDHLEWSRY